MTTAINLLGYDKISRTLIINPFLFIMDIVVFIFMVLKLVIRN